MSQPEEVTITKDDVKVVAIKLPHIEDLIARRERLIYRMGKYADTESEIRRRYAECQKELLALEPVISEILKRVAAGAALPAPERRKPQPGDVTIEVPTARGGAAAAEPNARTKP